MSLLLAGVDKTTIQLVGRWKSDAIFTYLHSSALPLIKDHACKMLRHGRFTTLTAPSQAALRVLSAFPDDDLDD
jgi:hypothetical protein